MLVTPTDALTAGAIAGIAIGSIAFVVLAVSVVALRKKIFPYSDKHREALTAPESDTTEVEPIAHHQGRPSTWQKSVQPTNV